MTNQWVNSYKRLVPGYEAPVHVSWTMSNRLDLIRVPSYKTGYERRCGWSTARRILPAIRTWRSACCSPPGSGESRKSTRCRLR